MTTDRKIALIELVIIIVMIITYFTYLKADHQDNSAYDTLKEQFEFNEATRLAEREIHEKKADSLENVIKDLDESVISGDINKSINNESMGKTVTAIHSVSLDSVTDIFSGQEDRRPEGS